MLVPVVGGNNWVHGKVGFATTGGYRVGPRLIQAVLLFSVLGTILTSA